MLDFDGGEVVITKGKHKNKIGIWDDDSRNAIVYFGEPFKSECVFVRYSYIRKASPKEIKKFKLHCKNKLQSYIKI